MRQINGVTVLNCERVDDLQRGGRLLIQNPSMYCFGIDSVLLSDFCRVYPNENTLDLCTGSGVIPILLEAKTKGRFFAGIEAQEQTAEMAQRNVLLNKLSEKVRIDRGDVKKVGEIYTRASFDVVTANPPYIRLESGLTKQCPKTAAARHELLCTIEDIAQAAALLLKPNGRFYMVHRPHRLVDIFCALRQSKLEPKEMQLVYPRENRPPVLVLIKAIKGGAPFLKTLEGIFLNTESSYSCSAEK